MLRTHPCWFPETSRSPKVPPPRAGQARVSLKWLPGMGISRSEPTSTSIPPYRLQATALNTNRCWPLINPANILITRLYLMTARR